jgi:hypothetical protein
MILILAQKGNAHHLVQTALGGKILGFIANGLGLLVLVFSISGVSTPYMRMDNVQSDKARFSKGTGVCRIQL